MDSLAGEGCAFTGGGDAAHCCPKCFRCAVGLQPPVPSSSTVAVTSQVNGSESTQLHALVAAHVLGRKWMAEKGVAKTWMDRALEWKGGDLTPELQDLGFRVWAPGSVRPLPQGEGGKGPIGTMLDRMMGPQARAGGGVRAGIRGYRVAGQQGQGGGLRQSLSLWMVSTQSRGWRAPTRRGPHWTSRCLDGCAPGGGTTPRHPVQPASTPMCNSQYKVSPEIALCLLESWLHLTQPGVKSSQVWAGDVCNALFIPSLAGLGRSSPRAAEGLTAGSS